MIKVCDMYNISVLSLVGDMYNIRVCDMYNIFKIHLMCDKVCDMYDKVY